MFFAVEASEMNKKQKNTTKEERGTILGPVWPHWLHP